MTENVKVGGRKTKFRKNTPIVSVGKKDNRDSEISEENAEWLNVRPGRKACGAALIVRGFLVRRSEGGLNVRECNVNNLTSDCDA